VTRFATTVLVSLICLAGLAGTAGCGPGGGTRARWANGGGRDQRSDPAAAPDGDDAPGADGSPAAPGTQGSPSPGASGAPSPAGTDYLARVPAFGPRPPAERVHLPESGGGVPFLSRVPTDQPVAFLTIDDGWVKRPEALPLLQRAGVPVTLFLTINAIKDDPQYFAKLRDAGAVIEAHTLTHTNLKGKPYGFQKHEICGSADQLGQLYGRRPLLFRPPFGEKDQTTLKAVHDCKLHAAFFWKETIDKGIVRYQEGHQINRGDIILMHFRDRFVDDFIAALQAIKAAGLTPALLEDYVA
jgi:peptidoglycan/xylan/chitin deacetylase (PgdA/CDA1 family)